MEKILCSCLIILALNSCNLNYDLVSNPIRDFEILLNRRIASIKIEEFIILNDKFIEKGMIELKKSHHLQIYEGETDYKWRLGKSDIWYYSIKIEKKDTVSYDFKIIGDPEAKVCLLRLTGMSSRKLPITDKKDVESALHSFEDDFVRPFRIFLE